MNEISPNVWAQVTGFIQRHPSVGVVFVIVPLLPVLSNVLDDDDPIGPILWALIIVIALPALFSMVRAVIDSFEVEKTVRKILVWCFGLCCSVLMLAGTAFLCMVLYQNVLSGDVEMRAAAPITDAERAAASTAPPEEPRMPVVFRETTETVELPPQRTEPTLDPNDTPALPDATETVVNDSYDRCILFNFERGNAEGILSCTALLEG